MSVKTRGVVVGIEVGGCNDRWGVYGTVSIACSNDWPGLRDGCAVWRP